MIDNITGIILAGGKSSRMGEDKSFIAFQGRPLIESVIDKLSTLFKDLIIITNNSSPYKKYKIKTYIDIIKDRGPLGGIYTGLYHSNTKYNFIVACDMPFLNISLVEYMVQRINGYDVVIAKRLGRLHPLFGIYSQNCIKFIKGKLVKDNLKIRDFFKYVKVKIITDRETGKFDENGLSFVNINTPEDYRSLNYERI